MKKMFLLAAFVCVMSSFSAEAQHEEAQVLIGNDHVKVTGFGGVMVEIASIQRNTSIMTGGGGAALFNDCFFFGGYGMGLTNDLTSSLNGQEYKIQFGHGGFYTGYLFHPNKLVHVGISSTLGWGSIDLAEINQPETTVASDQVFVISPRVKAEVNITHWFRLNGSVGYRSVMGVNTDYFGRFDFSSPAVMLGFLFGGFK